VTALYRTSEATLRAEVDAAVEARTKLDPSFTRTDATLEAWALWVAAESAKGGV